MKDEKESQNEAENIRVAVRCRPMNDREIREQAASCFKAENGNAVLTNLENPSERHEFGFDHVYGIDVAQVTVFNDIGAPILDRAFGGYNGTIFAYGQTGSGKTFSMSGVRGHDELEGLIPRMNRAIFERIQREKTENPQKLFLVECSFFEIYNEIIYDLLDSSGNAKKNKGGLEIKEHAVLGIYVKDLQERVVESREEVIDLMQQGQNARTVGYTQMNSESSRSHSIFIIKIHQKDATDETKNIFAKINLVDLAGSERAASTGAQGDRLKEGANINKSLSALGNVINALVEASRAGKKVFIPYRNSKLTRVLQESLGGNSLCSMLATLSPASINFVETLSTLKYASRAKSIKVNAKKNEASSQISQLNEEIAALKKKLTEQTSSTLGLDPKEKDEIVKKYEQQIKEMDRVRLQTWEDKAKLSKQHEMERKRLAKEKALADQKVREERTRKWKLLEEKGDVELMLRALRDLDRSSGSTGCAPMEDKWLARSQTMKSLETEAKDHRTMIVVFKDAIDKDVDHWGKRLVRQDSTVTAAARRDDTAATHMIVNQLCSKLQNVFDESKQLVAMEKKLTEDGRELINEMMAELTLVKEKRKVAKAAPASKPASSGGSPATAADAQRGKEDDQIQEEREKGLSMTLALILRQRAKLITTIKMERQKMFDLSKVCNHFIKYMDSFIAAFGAVRDAETTASLEKWTAARECLVKASAVWENEWPKGQSIEETADSVPVTYTPKGEVAALGLESKLIPDDCLYPSSRKTDAKLLRMNSPNFWIPDENDAVAFAVVDLEFPRYVQSISMRGGNTAGAAPIATSTTPQPGGGSSPVPITTFELKPTEELVEIAKRYKLDEITGEHEATYEIMSHVMSWQDLIKTTLLPTKLFVRPPIRFLHDIISVVIHNTGYAKDLFSPSERDYANLVSKTERVDFLTKILDFVQEDYRAQEGGPPVMIAATASNILAGKEPTDTLKFLCCFSIAALQWAIKNPPVKTKKPSDATTKSDGSPIAQAEASNGAMDQGASGDGENQQPSGRSGWVKKMRISTSLTGRTWRILGDFDANTDDTSLQMISFPPGTNAVGRFVQLTCIEWHELPLFQVEIYGQEASESDDLVKTMERMGIRATEMVQQLQASVSLFADEARASWEKAKDAEREKQEELIKLMAEITRLKQSNAEFEKEIKELQQSKTMLQQNVKTETKRLAEEKTKCEKLQGELQQNTTSTAEIKKEKEALSVKLNEHAHSIQTMTLQLSTQSKELESLQKSKVGLEELCSTLRTQLQAKSQEEGHQESKLASVMSDLMAVNVQLDEYRRRYESSEQMRKEQEAANQQMHTQLQDQLTQLSEKERLAQKLLNEKVVEAGRSLAAIQTEKDDIRRKLDETLAAATASNAANDALRTQMSALQDELEVWKTKLAEAQAPASPTKAAIEAANAASTNASQQASEQMMLEAQTKELRCIAELEKMELKVQSYEQKQREAESKLQEVEGERDTLSRRITELEELEDELQMQLQVVTEERDAARAKEEQLFVENNEKEQEIERIRDGYVWVTDRMNSKEDELAEMQEQLEKYQALVQITTASGKKKESENAELKHLMKLYALATGQSEKQASTKPDEVVKELTLWIETAKSAAVPSQMKPTSAVVSKADSAPKAAAAAAPVQPSTTPHSTTHSTQSTSSSQIPTAADASSSSNQATRAKTPRLEEAPPTKVSVPAPSAPETDASAVLVPKVKSVPESNQPASKEQNDEPPKRPKSPREPQHVDPSPGPKPELNGAPPAKPVTPRRDGSPPVSARKVNGSNGTSAAATSNQASLRPEEVDGAAATGGDDAYDDDFDADEPDEAKKRMGRKASAKAVQPAQ